MSSNSYFSAEYGNILIKNFDQSNAQSATTKSYVDQKVATSISDLIADAPDALNTLNEIAAQLSNDQNAVSALTNTVATNKEQIKAFLLVGDESKSVQQIIDDEPLYEEFKNLKALYDYTHVFVDGQVANVNSSIAVETAARSAAVSGLQSNIDAETSNRQDAVSSLESSLKGSAVTYQNLGAVEQKLQSLDATLTGGIASFEYMYIGNHWRIKAANNGSRLEFQHSVSGSSTATDWKVGIPFIFHQ